MKQKIGVGSSGTVVASSTHFTKSVRENVTVKGTFESLLNEVKEKAT